MTSWILDSIGVDRLRDVRIEAARRLLSRELSISTSLFDRVSRQDQISNADLSFACQTLEVAVTELVDDLDATDSLRQTSADAFELLRVLPRPSDPLDAAQFCVRLGCLGVLGERGVDVTRLLTDNPWPSLPVEASDWGQRVMAIVLDVWLCLLRKNGWNDLDRVLNGIVALRAQQRAYEATYLDQQHTMARTAARELMALYHLAKAADTLATFTTQGHVGERFDIREQLEAQFDRAVTACERAELIELDILTRLLARTARQMADNCIWTVTRGAIPRITQFVQELVSRTQDRPLFDMMPPQRRALREAGLLGSGRRSVVINLPTSSGKTVIAQFRIIQALNQFEQQRGWVAYLAPTRTLVNQIATRLRRDFAPLNINVERVSPSLEIDGMEARLLMDRDEDRQFHVLVTTPEKLDLLIRGGWEERIERPLTLVIVDEAHNLAVKERGIKLELLLATINRECRNAQFLLMTPFIDNAGDIARWLDPEDYQDISITVAWRPNDRAIVLSRPQRGERSGSFRLSFETIHTTKQTLDVPEALSVGPDRPLGLRWSDVNGLHRSNLAAATTQVLKSRGPVIVLAKTVPNAWSLAKHFMHPSNSRPENTINDDVRLVQRYVKREFGEKFLLAQLLEYGVGVHHSGLSDEVRSLMEWLFERQHIDVLVSTTTVAQGVNFPVSGVVLAAHQYPPPPQGGESEDMSAAEFWNLAGRAGRAGQGSIGIVALAAPNDELAEKLREFVGHKVLDLNSRLVEMVQDVMQEWGEFSLHSLHNKPEWSAFLQYLAHTYRQIGNPDRFASEIEQVLRGTLGFQNVRRLNRAWATQLVDGVDAYGRRIAGKSLKLVDSTGWSWESVNDALISLGREHITADVWEPRELFYGT